MMTTQTFPSLKSATGWIFCGALAVVLLSLLIAPPTVRDLPAFTFPQSLTTTGRGGKPAGTLVGEPVDIVSIGGWHLPTTHRYRYVPTGQPMAGDVDILATYYFSPRIDARKFPELYATCPWRSPGDSESGWSERATQRIDGERRAWLQVNDWQGTYLVARVGPDGNCTSTAAQVKQRRMEGWRREPWKLVNWPFSTRPEVDQRAVWVRMTVNKRVDGEPRSTQEIEQLWGEVLAAMSGQARASLRP